MSLYPGRQGVSGWIWDGQTVPEFGRFRDRILSVPGKRGLNAFVGTHLEETLWVRGITDVVFCGSVASICIDSTGRYAAEHDFRVVVVGDCITGRTHVEHGFYNHKCLFSQEDGPFSLKHAHSRVKPLRRQAWRIRNEQRRNSNETN
jgi:hypothetical protein